MFNFISTAKAAPIPPGGGLSYCELLVNRPDLWNRLELRGLVCIFNRLYNTAIAAVGAIFIIWAIVSGMRYMAAGGDEKALAAARQSLNFAVLGFILVVGAYATVQILSNVIGWALPVPPFSLPASSP